MRASILITILLFLSLSQNTQADVLYEGWHKIISSGSQVGYFVQRYEFDKKSKEFISTYYLKTNAAGGDITESLRATANKAFRPIAYQYTTAVGKSTKTIDASVKGDSFLGTVKEGGQSKELQLKLDKETFFSTFLVYLILNSPDGLKENKKYNYSAIAEEDGAVYQGEAFVKPAEKVSGVTAFKVLNDYKKVRFISYITAKGEVVSTRSPAAGLVTQATTKEDATHGFTVDQSTLKLLFGTLPADSAIAKAAAESQTAEKNSPPAANANPEKWNKLNASPAPAANDVGKQGVPAGAGIEIKGSGDSTPAPAKDAPTKGTPKKGVPKKATQNGDEE